MADALKKLDLSMIDAIGQVGQASPAMMGIPRSMLTNSGEAALKPGQQYQFDINQILNYQEPMYQNGASLETGQAPNDDAGRWFRIKGNDGQSLVVERNYGPATFTGEGNTREYKQGPLTGYNVISDPGDFGGGWLTDGPEAAKMNGRPYDSFDATGKYTGSSKISNWMDSGVMGPWGALAVLAMPFAAAAMGAGAGAAGAAGAGGGALGGMAGVAEAGYGAGMGAGAIGAGGAGASAAAAAAAAESGGLLDGLGALETVSEGFGPAFEASVANAGAGGLGALETASEGFGPGYESWAAQIPQGWQLPVETASEGFGPQFEASVSNLTPGSVPMETAGETLSKSTLDGTNVFGANSAPGALDITALSEAAPGAASAEALTKITEGLGYTTPTMPPNPFAKTPWEEAMASPLTRALLNAGASTLVTSLLSGKKDSAASQLASVGAGGGSGSGGDTSMPDPLAQIRAAQNSVLDQLARRGRESTILTRTQ